MERFPKNARVCFIGDSITCNNGYVARAAAYYQEHLPEENINFYNCGTSGACSGDILDMFDSDIVSYRPTHAVLMLGVNDSGRDLRADGRSEELYNDLLNRFERFKSNFHILCEKLRAMGVEIILQTLVPVDEYSEFNTPTWAGSYAMIAGYAEFIRAYGKEQGYPVIDQFAAITKYLMYGNILFDDDRTHPNELGHYYLAKTILESQGLAAPDYAPIPAYLDKWRELVEDYRGGIITTECLLVRRYDLPAVESIPIVQEKLKVEQNPYVIGVATKYLQIKANADKIKKDMMDEMEIVLKARR